LPVPAAPTTAIRDKRKQEGNIVTETTNPVPPVSSGAHRSDTAPDTSALFSGGPPEGLESWLGLRRRGEPRFARRALIAVAIGWVPLALLAAARGDLLRSNTADSFLLDLGVHTRFLVATPLLILAEALCVPRLAAVARQFLEGGLLAPADHPRYNQAVSSCQRLMRSPIVALAVIVLAYFLVFVLAKAAPPETIPAWHGRLSPLDPSPAGWWALLISLPLLLMLLLRWLWRICIWARFLWLMDRLRLQLIPAHPDHAAGLRFVSLSLDGFLPIAFIMGAIAAGPVMNQVMHHHADPVQFRSVALAAAGIVVTLCAGPLLVFVPRLARERKRGALQYSPLAMGMGERFQRKWLDSQPRVDQGTLDMSEFTGTNAAFSIAGNAFVIRLLPVELRSVGVLIVATFVPFVPAWMLSMPFDEIVKKLGTFML
jgi:hypothetical protein